jgi:hypothetical protein
MSDAGDYRVVVTHTCGGSVTSVVATLTVTTIPPVAVNDRVGGARNMAVEIPTSLLLANDSDADGGILSVTAVTSPSRAGGTVALAGTTVTYTPPANFGASDTFNYTVTDGQGGFATGVVCVVVANSNNLLYAEPGGGWTYIYNGSSATAGADNSGYTSLDGTWNHDDGSDAWARDGIGGVLASGSNPPGGVSSIDGYLRVQDSGDPRNNGFSETDAGGNAGSVGSNRKMYFGRDLTALGTSGTLLNDGVTLTFRIRVPTSGILDSNYPGPAGVTNAYPAGGDGYFTHDGGKGNIGIRQGAGGIISFSLFTTNDTTALGPGLIMNHRAGAAVSGNVDVGDVNAAITATNVLALDPTQWHEFWVTIVADTSSGGTHRVSIYRDGSSTPTVFHVTAGNGAEAQFGGTTSYLAIGTGSTGQSGAVDVDFFGFKAGVLTPSDPERPQLRIVPEGGNVVISWPQTCGNFVLESTSSLTPPISWSAVAAAVTAVGDRYQVTVPATSTNFFRLVQQ